MVYGLVLCLLTGLIAMWLGGLQHFVGAPMLGLFLGIIMANILPEKLLARFRRGAGFSSKYMLKTGIILAGGTLNFSAVLGVGLSALPLIIFNILLSFLIAHLIGRAMKISSNTCTLVGGGTAICGGTAIATLTPIVNAKEEEMAYAMSAIFLFDILAAILWPYAARAMELTPMQYGILGGLAISDTSSVTAASATYDAIMGVGAVGTINGESLTGGDMAVIVKLTRTVMLVVVAVVVMIIHMLKGDRKTGGAEQNAPFGKRVVKAFPLFVLGFLLMAVLNTVLGFSGIKLGGLALSTLLSKAYKYFISVAMVGVGFKIRLRSLLTEGMRSVALGGCTWLAVAISTLSYALLLA